MNIVDEVKKETFLFSDNQIENTITNMQNNETLNELQKADPEYIMLYCYKDKGQLTKEEYDIEVLQYLYQHAQGTKEHINQVIDKNKDWYDSYYKDAENNNLTYYHAVQWARENMMHLFCTK